MDSFMAAIAALVGILWILAPPVILGWATGAILKAQSHPKRIVPCVVILATIPFCLLMYYQTAKDPLKDGLEGLLHYPFFWVMIAWQLSSFAIAFPLALGRSTINKWRAQWHAWIQIPAQPTPLPLPSVASDREEAQPAHKDERMDHLARWAAIGLAGLIALSVACLGLAAWAAFTLGTASTLFTLELLSPFSSFCITVVLLAMVGLAYVVWKARPSSAARDQAIGGMIPSIVEWIHWARFGFFSARGLLVLLLAAPFIAAAGMAEPWLLLGLLIVTTALVAILADVRMSVRPSDLYIERIADKRLSLGADNRIELRVRNYAARTVDVWVRDDAPVSFVMDECDRILMARVKPHGEARLVYHVRPTRRGDYVWGNLALRWNTALGLAVRQATWPASAPIQVYPNLLKIRAYDLLVRRGRVDEIGLRPMRRFGQGSEFEQLREYRPDDDYRRISWKATARHAKPITVEFQAERNQNVVIAVDVGRAMMSRSADDLARLDFVVNAVVLFSYIATLKGDRVGLLTFADDVLAYLAPQPGRRQFQRILETLYRIEAQPVEPDYARALQFLAGRHQRRALVVMFTDLNSRDAAHELTMYLGALCPHHLPLCVTLGDPNMASAAGQVPRDLNSVYERAVAEQVMDDRQVWLDTLGRRGILTLDVSANQLELAVINKYLEIKGRGRM